MTYLDVYQLVLSEAGINIPVKGVTSFMGMVWITEAIHNYQVATGVARCVDDLELDPESTDGHYTIDSDIEVIEKIDYIAAENAPPQPVNVYGYDSFMRLQSQGLNPFPGILPGQFTSVQSLPFYPQTGQNYVLPGGLPSPYYATRLNDCTLIIQPFQNLSGVLRIYYKPYLMPYTPGAEGRWKKFGNPPDAMMASEHIPREFNSALEGIKGYCMAKVLQTIPNHEKIFPGAWQQYMNNYMSASEAILRKHPVMNNDLSPTPNMTGRVI